MVLMGGFKPVIFSTKINQLNFGMTVFGFNTNYLFTNSFGYITRQEKSNTEAALYVSYKHVFLDKNVSYSTRIDKAFERVVLEPSIRLHYFNDQQYFSPEPRLRTKFNFNRFQFECFYWHFCAKYSLCSIRQRCSKYLSRLFVCSRKRFH